MLLKSAVLLLLAAAVTLAVGQNQEASRRNPLSSASRLSKLSPQQQAQRERVNQNASLRRLVSNTRVEETTTQTSTSTSTTETPVAPSAPLVEVVDLAGAGLLPPGFTPVEEKVDVQDLVEQIKTSVLLTPVEEAPAKVKKEPTTPAPTSTPNPPVVEQRVSRLTSTRPAVAQPSPRLTTTSRSRTTTRRPQPVTEAGAAEEETEFVPAARLTRPRTQSANRPVQSQQLEGEREQPKPVRLSADSASIRNRQPVDDDEPRRPIIETIRRYSFEGTDGSLTFGYEGADGSFKEETRGADCVVRGKYGYIDPDGIRREFSYTTGVRCDEGQKERPQEEISWNEEEILRRLKKPHKSRRPSLTPRPKSGGAQRTTERSAFDRTPLTQEDVEEPTADLTRTRDDPIRLERPVSRGQRLQRLN